MFIVSGQTLEIVRLSSQTMSMFPYTIATPEITLEVGQKLVVNDPNYSWISWKMSVKAYRDCHRLFFGLEDKVKCSMLVSMGSLNVDGVSIDLSQNCILCVPKHSHGYYELDSDMIGAQAFMTVTVYSMQTSHLSLFRGDFFAKDNFTDCTVQCQGSVFHAHRNVLSCMSPVFASAFTTEGMKEAESSCITIDDVEPAVVHEFLKALYENATLGEQVASNLW